MHAKVIQYAEQLGGTLNVHVYAGRNNTFALVEDDGASLDYLKQSTKTTVFEWNDAASILVWTSVSESGYQGSPQDFTTIKVTLFRSNDPIVSTSQTFGSSGSVAF